MGFLLEALDIPANAQELPKPCADHHETAVYRSLAKTYRERLAD